MAYRACAPHIKDLARYGYYYILGAKPGDHQHLFESVIDAGDNGKLHNVKTKHLDKQGSTSETQWAKQIPLNASHSELLVNFIDHTEFSSGGSVTKRFSWVTDLAVTAGVVGLLVRAGRSRWRIENETFNTLKNQGYHFEHNYGHGKQNLSTVLATVLCFAFTSFRRLYEALSKPRVEESRHGFLRNVERNPPRYLVRQHGKIERLPPA